MSARLGAAAPAHAMTQPNTYRSGPDGDGNFGPYGGRFVAETLMPLVLALEEAWGEARDDPAFQAEFESLLRHYVGRPSPLTRADRITERLGGATVYFKRDELNHTGAHKINNCIGQILLARRMGKTRIIAETGAGQHGVADGDRVPHVSGFLARSIWAWSTSNGSSPNVFRMKLLGAEVVPVTSGSRARSRTP